MPTYDYRCEQCGTFEQWQSIKDDALSACPKCGSKVERLISANVGFVFKGSGFYQNEYKNTPSESPKSAPVTNAPVAAPAVAPVATPAPPAGGCGCCSEKSSCPSAAN